MDKSSYELSVIAYYLSKFDMKAVRSLGYKTRTEAFIAISEIMGRPNNYLKLRRDEFDVLTDSTRKGWHNRPVNSEVKKIFDELSVLSRSDLEIRINAILAKSKADEVEKTIETESDAKYIYQVNKFTQTYVGAKNIHETPTAKPKVKVEHTTESFSRDPRVAANALCNAEYKCEVCAEHETFIRKSNGKPYTEPHHLIPMKYQDKFTVSLDVENNIISLCSNCHNRLHYGKDIDEILCSLYENRKEVLIKAGIEITYDELKKLY